MTPEELFDGIDTGAARGVLATIGLTEILSRPAALGDGRLLERYAEELRSIPGLRLVALDPETAVDAAWGRAAERDLGDAIHLATARGTLWDDGRPARRPDRLGRGRCHGASHRERPMLR